MKERTFSAEDTERLALDIYAIEKAMPTLEKLARVKLNNAMPGATMALRRLSMIRKSILPNAANDD